MFGLSTGKYGPEITSHVDTFHAVPQSSKNEFWGKSTVANINIFSITHIPRPFTDRIRRTQKIYIKIKRHLFIPSYTTKG